MSHKPGPQAQVCQGRSASALRWTLGGAILAMVASVSAQTPEIDIEGGNEALRSNVRSYIDLGEEPCDTPDWRLRARLGDLDEQIQKAAQALGYYHLQASRRLTRDDECWALSIELTPGEPVRIGEMDVRILGDGADDPAFRAALAGSPLSEGRQLNHGEYEALKGRFEAVASARGYFDGRFETARVTVDKSERTAHVALTYQTGPRYRFGEVHLKHDILSEDLLRRYLNFEPGGPYDMNKLLELKNRYTSSDYFAYARVTPRLQALGDQEVPVDVELEGRKRHGYSAGIGYATDTGARLLLGYDNRYVNRRGHVFNADTRVSEIGSELTASYRIPMSRPAHEDLRLYTGFQREDVVDTESDLLTVGTSYTRSEEGSDWFQTYAINFEREKFTVGESRQRSDLLIPSVSLSRTESVETAYPTSGWSLLGRLSGSPERLGSDFSFIQIYGRFKYIQSIGSGRLLFRAEGGATEVADFSQLPVSQRFFAGGDASVRGYDYRSLGPTVMDPETGRELVVGGSNMWVHSIEYDYRFLPSWAAAVFFDQGNAFDDTDVALKRGLGLGLRWISPVGPVRVDVARALDEPQGWTLHLSIGPDL